MDKFRRFEIWLTLAMLALLAVLSIGGAFLGAEKAAAFFSSLPLTIYWIVLTVLLLAGLVTFRRLIGRPSSLLMHLGCVIILAGSMWGSTAGHNLQKKLFGIDKVRLGFMVIDKGMVEYQIFSKSGQILGQLPFSLKLADFRIEYYAGKSELRIESNKGGKWEIPAEAGREVVLDGTGKKIKIVHTFENLKISINGSQKVAYDEKDAGSNPAAEIEIAELNGQTKTQYVFEKFPQTEFDPEGLKILYQSQRDSVRDYLSDIVVLKAKKPVLQKTIEVNHPLHYGGYHFYQYSCDFENGRYTVLSVVSDSGMLAVYNGFMFLGIGAIWHFWISPVAGYFKRRKNGN